jgi:hypothetical protein
VSRLLELDDESVDWNDLSTMKSLTCVNHPTAKYLTKNPWTRGLHFISPCDEAPFGDQSVGVLAAWECPCPFSDLRVVAHDD